MSQATQHFNSHLKRRKQISHLFAGACLIATWFSLVVLVILLVGVMLIATGFWDPTGAGGEARNWLTWGLLTNHISSTPEEAGVVSAIWGSAWLILMTGLISVPIGVGAAIYLEEYAREGWLTRFIRLNIANLAGVPSIVFGILGLTVFVRMFGMFPDAAPRGFNLGFAVFSIPIPFGKTLLSGAFTLSLLILPIVIIASQEALRSVPQSIRHASIALGATKWQTIWNQVIPASLPGVMTGVILSLSRAIGETAPLIVVGATSFILFNPGHMEQPTDYITQPQTLLDVPSSQYTVLPLQIFYWALNSPNPQFKSVAAAAIVVLLIILLVMNGLAVYIRHHFSKRLDW